MGRREGERQRDDEMIHQAMRRENREDQCDVERLYVALFNMVEALQRRRYHLSMYLRDPVMYLQCWGYHPSMYLNDPVLYLHCWRWHPLAYINNPVSYDVQDAFNV